MESRDSDHTFDKLMSGSSYKNKSAHTGKPLGYQIKRYFLNTETFEKIINFFHLENSENWNHVWL